MKQSSYKLLYQKMAMASNHKYATKWISFELTLAQDVLSQDLELPQDMLNGSKKHELPQVGQWYTTFWHKKGSYLH
jgi:hypothetical protein